jgi:tRNA threonylcarbamoyladenosine biosynthesis protein TsaE
MSCYLPDEAATAALAARIARRLPADLAGWTMLLEGSLGTGKSTFARALLRTLGHTGPVPSPTYTLVEPYRLATGTVYHVDLYRVASAEELRFLGWTDLDDGLRLVEWPDRAPGLADSADLKICFEYEGSGRRVTVEGLSTRGSQLAARAAAAA